jgi:NYN domain
VTTDGRSHVITVGEEKGIDIRIALDCVSLALSNDLDVAVVFSQDQDMSEVVDEIKKIVRLQKRWIKVACAYPMSPTASNRRGINGSQWIPFDEATYKCCIDPL